MKRADQLRMLREINRFAIDLEDAGETREDFKPDAAKAMADMLGKLEDGFYDDLSAKQISFVKAVYKRLFPESDGELPVLVSSGEIPRGREVPLPECLRRENLPMRPPGRRA